MSKRKGGQRQQQVGSTSRQFADWWNGPAIGRSSGDRKALQLARQVERALSYILGDLSCDALSSVMVEGVTPAPNASRLLVTIRCLDDEIEVAEVLEHLHAAYPTIRLEVAASISRKRVPELVFQCLSSNAQRE